MNLSPHRMAVLLAVQRSGGVVAAADLLHISPSAVSQQVRALERESGTRLLDRTPTGAVLTPAGRVLTTAAERIEDELAAATRELVALDGSTPTGLVRVGSFATAVRALASRAERVVVLTESEKLGGHGPVPLLGADDVAALWTDSAAPDAQVDALTGAGVEVVTVAADGAAVVHPAQARPEPDRVVGGDSAPTALTAREEPS